MPEVANAARHVIRWSIGAGQVAPLIEEAASVSFARNLGTAFGAKISPRRVTSPFDMASAPGGAAARNVAGSAEARNALDAVAVRDVRLTATTYVLYDAGSYIGVHTDRPGCDLNLLILLSGAPAVFECLPSLTEESADVIFELARRGHGFIDGGETVDLGAAGAAVAFIGSVLPHQRRPTSRPLLMLSLCYSYSAL